MVGGRDQAKSTDERRVRDIIPDFVVIARRHGRRVTLFIIPRDKHICASLLCRAGSVDYRRLASGPFSGRKNFAIDPYLTRN